MKYLKNILIIIVIILAIALLGLSIRYLQKIGNNNLLKGGLSTTTVTNERKIQKDIEEDQGESENSISK